MHEEDMTTPTGDRAGAARSGKGRGAKNIAGVPGAVVDLGASTASCTHRHGLGGPNHNPQRGRTTSTSSSRSTSSPSQDKERRMPLGHQGKSRPRPSGANVEAKVPRQQDTPKPRRIGQRPWELRRLSSWRRASRGHGPISEMSWPPKRINNPSDGVVSTGTRAVQVEHQQGEARIPGHQARSPKQWDRAAEAAQAAGHAVTASYAT